MRTRVMMNERLTMSGLMKKTFQEVRFSIFILLNQSWHALIKWLCQQELVTRFELKKLINSRIVSMNNQSKFRKPISDFHMARVN